METGCIGKDMVEQHLHLVAVGIQVGDRFGYEVELRIAEFLLHLPRRFLQDFISHIKKNYPALRIIMISGYDGAARDIAIENGADIFLEKPFTRSQLYDAIKSLLPQPEATA